MTNILFFIIPALIVAFGIFSYAAIIIHSFELKSKSLMWSVFSASLLFGAAYRWLIVNAMNAANYEVVRPLYYVLGFLNFFFFSALLYFLLIFIFKLLKKKIPLRKKKTLGSALAILALLVSLFAVWNFEKGISVEKYDISSPKVSRDYSFLQVSDIQFGSVDHDYLRSVVDQINEQDVEFVVFTGDLVDFDYYTREDLLVLGDIKFPVYFERGNHEFYHFPEKILSHLEQVDTVKVLRDESVSFDEIQISAIDYKFNDGEYFRRLDSLEVDRDKFSILLYHEPKNVEETALEGFDLLLYGHTHGGQIWPYTWVVDMVYPYGDGFHTVGSSSVYTSDGAALWGPRMRLGSQNEMVIFRIKPLT